MLGPIAAIFRNIQQTIFNIPLLILVLLMLLICKKCIFPILVLVFRLAKIDAQRIQTHIQIESAVQLLAQIRPEILINFMLKQLLPRNPELHIHHQHFVDNVFDHRTRGDFSAEPDVSRVNVVDQLLRAFPVKRRRAVDHLVEAAPQGSDIRLGVVALPLQDFGGHVEGRPQNGVAQKVVADDFGKTEIRDFDVLVVEQNVGQFEIAVHDFVLADFSEALQNLQKEIHGLLFRKSLLLLQEVLQVSLVAVLQHQVDVVLGLFDVDEFDDEGAVQDLQDFDFALQELELALGESALFDHFDGHHGVGGEVSGPEDGAELPPADFLFQDVVVN